MSGLKGFRRLRGFAYGRGAALGRRARLPFAIVPEASAMERGLTVGWSSALTVGHSLAATKTITTILVA